MFKKLYYILLSCTASMLLAISAISANTMSFGHHGEPDCPEELLK